MILKDGMKYYLKLYGLIASLDMLTPFEIVYGQEVILPVEVNLGA
jgi:hypothetical protein